MENFKIITVNRKDLELALSLFDTKSEYVHFGLQTSTIDADKILWVDNGKFGNDSSYIRINNKEKENGIK